MVTFFPQMRILENVVHATNLAAAILNAKAYSNLTGLLRVAPFPFYPIQDDELIPIQLRNDNSIEYYFHGKFIKSELLYIVNLKCDLRGLRYVQDQRPTS